ncbi:microtubule-associated serine/threonine-protein kinase 4-like, partial [Tropilaelaps mercedesae]
YWPTPTGRLCSSSYLEVRSHSFFAEIDWNAVSSGAATFDCTHLIEHTRDAASALNSDAATLGVCVHAENEGKLPMFTYTSQGFGRVIQKLLKKRKIQPLDIVDPHEIIPPSVKYVYKFKDYRKTQARQKSSPRNPMTQTVSSISIEEARGSEHFSDRPSLTNAKTSILSFVKELRNGL